MASWGVAFYAMSRLTDRTGQWEAFISGVLLIVTAVTNPDGIAGGVRRRLDLARSRRAQAVAP